MENTNLSWTMYTTIGTTGKMMEAYHNELQITMFSEKTPVKVAVTIAKNPDEATHWGWLRGEDISMVQASLLQLDLCFPSDPTSREKAGEGLRTPLVAKPFD